MPGSLDLFCTADDNEYEAKLIPHAVFNPIESIWGHLLVAVSTKPIINVLMTTLSA